MTEKKVGSYVWRGRFFRYAPLILYIFVIFYTSSSQASFSETSRFVRPLLEFLFPNAPEETLYFYHVIIRKCAHFAVYAVLGFFASRAFWNSRIDFLNRYWHILAFVLALAVASADEINQSFNPTRTGLISDVLLDAASALVIVLGLVVYKRYRNN